MQSLRALGHDVRSAAFRRSNMNTDFEPDWPNIELGSIENERFFRRSFGMLRGLVRVMRHSESWRDADVIIARNFDLLAIGWSARLLLRRRKIPLVYECLDIHRLLTDSGPVGRIIRWCERQLLRQVQLLIVSSPRFVSAYFKDIQRYDGSFAIIENKLWFDADALARPKVKSDRPANVPLTLGWVGSIRCAPSLRLLLAAADQMGPAVRLKIHGNVHRHALPGFDAEVAVRDNVSYHGAYQYPNDLASIYGESDLVWAQDLWQRGGNSDWLLPNRIYEASWFGCPQIAVADTETGRRIASDGLGLTIDAPTPAALVAALEKLEPKDITRMQRHILNLEDERFRLRESDIARALSPVIGSPPHRRIVEEE
ncbi:glycosyltransferase [Roseovarius aestuarii]|uniref:glycosyltransferase n=1 Tax=Roseovarius aestuarii TaxID=475083 RepID=UPI002958CA75|nr:glycosyltransferase [Roseovarius aestuarii]